MVSVPDVFGDPLPITNPWRKLSSSGNRAEKPKQTGHDLLATWQELHNMSKGASQIKWSQQVRILWVYVQ